MSQSGKSQHGEKMFQELMANGKMNAALRVARAIGHQFTVEEARQFAADKFNSFKVISATKVVISAVFEPCIARCDKEELLKLNNMFTSVDLRWYFDSILPQVIETGDYPFTRQVLYFCSRLLTRDERDRLARAAILRGFEFPSAQVLSCSNESRCSSQETLLPSGPMVEKWLTSWFARWPIGSSVPASQAPQLTDITRIAEHLKRKLTFEEVRKIIALLKRRYPEVAAWDVPTVPFATLPQFMMYCADLPGADLWIQEMLSPEKQPFYACYSGSRELCEAFRRRVLWDGHTNSLALVSLSQKLCVPITDAEFLQYIESTSALGGDSSWAESLMERCVQVSVVVRDRLFRAWARDGHVWKYEKMLSTFDLTSTELTSETRTVMVRAAARELLAGMGDLLTSFTAHKDCVERLISEGVSDEAREEFEVVKLCVSELKNGSVKFSLIL